MNILLINPHSPKNAGDLAILHSSLARLQTAFPAARLSYTMTDPEPSPWLPAGVPVIPSSIQWVTRRTADGDWRWRKGRALGYVAWLLLVAILYRGLRWRWQPQAANQRRWMEAYYEADLIVGNGGGYLYGRNAANLPFLWLWLGMAMAALMGKRLLLMPQSYGPLPGRLQQAMLRWLVNCSELVMAREFRSVQFLSSIGVRQPVLLVPDLAFLTTEAPEEEAHELLRSWGVPANVSQPLVGMTLMDWGAQNRSFSHQARYEEAILTLISHVQTEYNAQVVIFAQCCGPTIDQDDRHIARRIAAAAQRPVWFVDTFLPASLLKAAYRQLDVLVATRMHSAIFSLSSHTPTFVIGYLHKSVGIMQAVGLHTHVVDITEIDPALVRQQFDALWGQRVEIRQHLAQRIPSIEHTLGHLAVLIRAAGAEEP